MHCTELVGASSGNRSVKSSEIGATNKSLETLDFSLTEVQSFQLLQYYFQAQFTFHQTWFESNKCAKREDDHNKYSAEKKMGITRISGRVEEVTADRLRLQCQRSEKNGNLQAVHIFDLFHIFSLFDIFEGAYQRAPEKRRSERVTVIFLTIKM